MNGANLAGVDLRAVDLTDSEFDQFESIAGVDFTLVQMLTEAMRSRLLSRPLQQLETVHPLTLKTTLESLTQTPSIQTPSIRTSSLCLTPSSLCQLGRTTFSAAMVSVLDDTVAQLSHDFPRSRTPSLIS